MNNPADDSPGNASRQYPFINESMSKCSAAAMYASQMGGLL